jgi:hypothetical protein
VQVMAVNAVANFGTHSSFCQNQGVRFADPEHRSEDRYPATLKRLNPSISWAEDVLPYSVMLKAHDIFVAGVKPWLLRYSAYASVAHPAAAAVASAYALPLPLPLHVYFI